ncbi:MAG: hypothetical protein HWD86_10765 [Kangiellaceae bacterium]|nr:hypothetical protein [Kangiellaceae bacterium]
MGRRYNARHREAEAKQQSEDGRGPNSHPLHMPATLANVNDGICDGALTQKADFHPKSNRMATRPK